MGNRIDKKAEEAINKQTKRSKKSGVKKFLIAFLVIILLVIISVTSFGWYTLNRISKTDVAPKAVSISKPVNILLLGVDAGDYTNHTKNNPNRSDTMMVVRFNPKTKRVFILSIPRDTKVLLKEHVGKLNAAHLAGVSSTISSIEKLLGFDINYYAEIDYQGFRECIDAIGGIDIKIPRDMNYDAWKISIHFKKGEIVHMDGKKAEEFVRWRKNNDGTGYAMGDLGRISTQQEFIVKLIEKLKTPTGMLKLPKLVNTFSKYLKTNMSATTIVEYAIKGRSIKTEYIEKKTLPGEAKYINGISYFVWNEDINDKFIANFKGIESLALPVPTNYKDVAKPNQTQNSGNESNVDVSRSNIDVVILNSTGKTGLAAKYKTKLETLGYRVTYTDNYKYKKYSYTLINDYSKHDYGNVLLGDLKLGTVKVKSKSKPKASLVVILGTDCLK